jgi:hypothetical protein
MRNFRTRDDVAPAPSPPAVGRLQVGMDLPFEQRWWRFERIVWTALWIFLLLGVLGIFGRGPLSRHSVHGAGGALVVTYDRFARFGTPTMMMLTISRRAAAPNGSVTVHISGTQMRMFPVQSIVPLPALERPDGAGGAYLTWFVPRGAGTATVYVAQMPVSAGAFESRVGLPGSVGVRFRQIVYP